MGDISVEELSLSMLGTYSERWNVIHGCLLLGSVPATVDL